MKNQKKRSLKNKIKIQAKSPNFQILEKLFTLKISQNKQIKRK